MKEINDYLETMFRPYSQTPRLREARQELQAMMEDAYANLIAGGATPNEAMVQVVMDFGNLSELAPTLGISDDVASAEAAEQAIYPAITMEEAQSFAETHRHTSPRLGIAIGLYVLSPIPLILLLAAADLPDFFLAPEIALSAGIVFFLIIAAIGTMMVVGVSGRFSSFRRLQEGRFTQDPSVVQWVNELSRRSERRYTAALTVAVLLWILSPAALIVVSLAPPTPLQGIWIATSTVLLLVLVAIGLYVVFREAWANSAAGAINRGLAKRASART